MGYEGRLGVIGLVGSLPARLLHYLGGEANVGDGQHGWVAQRVHLSGFLRRLANAARRHPAAPDPGWHGHSGGALELVISGTALALVAFRMREWRG